ncbi:MAG: LamG domain-containing protein, partial [Dehalococcoidales bacterium]|nr:LamG domain-containing protein [Dehalococcoidales bacterium]
DFGGDTDFTINFWMRGNVVKPNDLILAKREGSGSYIGWDIEFDGNGKIGFKLDSGAPQVFFFSDSELFDFKWHYVSAVADRDGRAAIYIDGIIENSSDIVSIGDIDNTSPLTIGWYSGSGAETGFDGLIDDVRIYNYARTAEQIREDYNAGNAAYFGPVGQECKDDPASCMTRGLVGYWNFNEGDGKTIYDGSGYSNNCSTTNFDFDKDSGWFGGKIGGALKLDGVNDYIGCGDQNVFSFGNSSVDGPFSLESWVYMEDLDSFFIVSKNDYNANQKREYVLYVGGDKKLTFLLEDQSAGGSIYRKYNTALTSYQNQWVHVTATYDGSSSNAGLKLYLNGVRVDDTGADSSYTAMENLGQPLELGSRSSYSQSADGLIDEVKIYSRELSVEEVRYRYNRGGPIGHWKFDEGSGTIAYDASGNSNHGTMYYMSTSTSGGWSQGKVGRALSFDLIDDYVDCGDDSIFSFAGAFTLEAWIKADSRVGGANAGIVGRAFNPALYVDIRYMPNIRIHFYNSSASVQYLFTKGGYSVSRNEWHHIVGTYDPAAGSNNMKLYIDGVLDNVATKTVVPTPTANLLIGKGETDFFGGLIDDVKVYNYVRTAEQVRADYNAGMSVYFK